MGLHPTLSKIKRNLPAVARANGFQARVTSGYRSRAKQAWLYNRYLQGLQQYPVAPPGYSDHEIGLALDVVSTDTPKLVSLLSQVGLSWAGPADPVHFSMKAPQIESQSPLRAYAEGPGSSIPSFLTALPLGIGTLFGSLKDPQQQAKSGLELLLTAILGPL